MSSSETIVFLLSRAWNGAPRGPQSCRASRSEFTRQQPRGRCSWAFCMRLVSSSSARVWTMGRESTPVRYSAQHAVSVCSRSCAILHQHTARGSRSIISQRPATRSCHDLLHGRQRLELRLWTRFRLEVGTTARACVGADTEKPVSSSHQMAWRIPSCAEQSPMGPVAFSWFPLTERQRSTCVYRSTRTHRGSCGRTRTRLSMLYGQCHSTHCLPWSLGSVLITPRRRVGRRAIDGAPVGSCDLWRR